VNGRLRQRLRRLKTLPVFPTLLTAGNLAAGITAVLCAASYVPGSDAHRWMLFVGAVAVFVAMICDMFDGKVARMTRTAGPFGAQLDSLADVVSFGVAPAILVHRLVLGQPGVFAYGERLLWFITVFYAVMAAIRLARYNAEHDEDSADASPWFRGLPSPGAAALVCGWVMFHQWAVIFPDKLLSQWMAAGGLITPAAWTGLASMDPFRWALVAVTAIAALLMVSTVRYPHVGNTLFGRMGFRSMIMLIAAVVALALIDLPYVLFAGTTGYVAWGLWSGWRQSRGHDDDDDGEADDLGAADAAPGDVGPAPGR
jgi:CDP-diacylglycerol---serine O-phosphatidyltransferase